MSSLTKWQQIQQRQGIANAGRWLNALQSDPNPFQLVLHEYDNLLRAIEYTLVAPENFDLAYQLIQFLHTYVTSYADWDRWLIYLQKAHHFSQLLQRKYEEATLLDMVGNIHRSQGNFEKARGCLSQAVALYQHESHVSEYAVSLSNLALLLTYLGKDGLDLCRTALAITEKSQDEIAGAKVLLNLSAIYMRHHEWQLALLVAQTAYDLTREPQYVVWNTRLLFNILTCLGRLEKWDEVNKTFSQMAVELIERGDIQTLAKLRNNLGVIAFNLSNWTEAEQHFQEALKLQSTIQEPVEMAYLYNNLGMVYTRMGELETAVDMLQKAIVIQEQLQDTYQWANAMDNLAEVYEATGDTALAHHIRQQAYTLLQTVISNPRSQTLLASLQAKIQPPMTPDARA